jgi:hypothetical protein
MTVRVHLFKTPDESQIQAGFICPGCRHGHSVTVKGPNAWGWNGDLEKPTFTPSILVWASRPEWRCHSFVTDGKIQFLGDCFHDLKNTTVDIPEYDADGYFRAPPAEPKT